MERSPVFCLLCENQDTSRRGVLTLLDCAGTERRNDSVHHSRERQKESAEINASLWALKECIRARAAGGKGKRIHVPYRSSNLTRVLRETLENEAALLCVVATVAPNATDTEHTLETLRTVSTLVGMDGSLEEGETHVVSNSPTNVKEEELLTPKQWNHQHLIDFLKKKRLYVNDVPSHLDGRLIMRMSPVQLKNILYDKDNADKADALFRLLRAENDRVSRILIKRRLASSQNQPVVV
jgi:kinesin family protein 2/24